MMYRITYTDRGLPSLHVDKEGEEEAWQLYQECKDAHPNAEVLLTQDRRLLAYREMPDP